MPEALASLVNSLKNLIEQDRHAHQAAGLARDGLRFVRGRVANPCRGFELMNMIRKGQMHGVGKGDIVNQVMFIASLFGVAS